MTLQTRKSAYTWNYHIPDCPKGAPPPHLPQHTPTLHSSTTSNPLQPPPPWVGCHKPTALYIRSLMNECSKGHGNLADSRIAQAIMRILNSSLVLYYGWHSPCTMRDMSQTPCTRGPIAQNTYTQWLHSHINSNQIRIILTTADLQGLEHPPVKSGRIWSSSFRNIITDSQTHKFTQTEVMATAQPAKAAELKTHSRRHNWFSTRQLPQTS